MICTYSFNFHILCLFIMRLMLHHICSLRIKLLKGDKYKRTFEKPMIEVKTVTKLWWTEQSIEHLLVVSAAAAWLPVPD